MDERSNNPFPYDRLADAFERMTDAARLSGAALIALGETVRTLEGLIPPAKRTVTRRQRRLCSRTGHRWDDWSEHWYVTLSVGSICQQKDQQRECLRCRAVESSELKAMEYRQIETDQEHTFTFGGSKDDREPWSPDPDEWKKPSDA
jgi:hypothetical protein